MKSLSAQSQSTNQSDWGVPIVPQYTEFPPSFPSDSNVDTLYPYSTNPSPTIPVAETNPSNYQALAYAAASDDPSMASTFQFGLAPLNPTNYEDPSYGSASFDPNINQAPIYGTAPGYPDPYQNLPYGSASVYPSSYQGPPYASDYSSINQVLAYGSAPSYETLPYEAASFDPSIFEGPPNDPSNAPTVVAAASAVPSNYEGPPY